MIERSDARDRAVRAMLPIAGEEVESAWEGCLSIPGLRGCVTRPRRVRFRGLDGEGRPVEGEAEGMAARVIQHETDHLDGVLYPMRMDDFTLFGFTEELARAAADGPPR